MTTLLMIRHGETYANHDGTFAGWTDVELRNKGREQAKKTADYIARTYKVDKVYASDLKRADETGRIIARRTGTQVTTDMRLREVFGGIWEGVRFDALMEKYPEEYRVWVNDIGNCSFPEGESIRQLAQRVFAAMEDIAKENDGKTVVVATHATPVRVMQCLLADQPLTGMKDIPWVSNASVTEITYENGTWRLVSQGYDAHLAELVTHLEIPNKE